METDQDFIKNIKSLKQRIFATIGKQEDLSPLDLRLLQAYFRRFYHPAVAARRTELGITDIREEDNCTFATRAARLGRAGVIKALAAGLSGFAGEPETVLNAYDGNGLTPALSALFHGDFPDVINALNVPGVDFYARVSYPRAASSTASPFNQTPAGMAALLDRRESIKALDAAGVDFTRPVNASATPVDIAHGETRTLILELIREKNGPGPGPAPSDPAP